MLGTARLVQIHDPPVNDHPDKTFFPQCRDCGGQRRIVVAAEPEGDHVPRAGGEIGQCRSRALRRVALHRVAAAAADHLADLGKQQPQVVGHFGRGADRRSARSAAAVGGHGDGGRNAVNPLGLGLFQAVEELAGVGRKALDVAALSLGIERIEGQAALAAAAEPAEHDELAVRDVQIDRFEVMDSHPAQRNVSRNGHGAS